MLACCDPTKLPTARRGSPREIQWPNPITINNGWQKVTVQAPSTILPLGTAEPCGELRAVPGENKPSDAASGAPAPGVPLNFIGYDAGASVRLPFAGDWWVYYGGATAFQAVVLDMPAMEALLFKREGYLVPTHTAVSVGVASGTALAANPRATYRMFQNDSANTIYLMIDAAAVVNQGIRLNASGGSYEMSGKNLSRKQVNAIATGAASNLLVLEGGTPVPT